MVKFARQGFWMFSLSHVGSMTGAFGSGVAMLAESVDRLARPPLSPTCQDVSRRLVCGCRSRNPSYEKKKKVLSFRMGPPKVPPKSFCRSGGLGNGGRSK